MTDSTELRQRLEAGIQELEGDIALLRSAIAALDNGESQSAAPRKRRSRAVTEPTTHDVVPAGKLVTLLGGSEGMTTAELAARTNAAPGQVLALLKELEQDGRAHRTGTRRSTRWHAGANGAGTSSDADAAVAAAEEQISAALGTVVAS